MSEKLLRILIDDLDLIRIVCSKCGSALEMPISKLDCKGSIQNLACPAACGTVYRIAQTYQSDALAKLADAVGTLKQVKWDGQLGGRIEFVLPGEKGD